MTRFTVGILDPLKLYSELAPEREVASSPGLRPRRVLAVRASPLDIQATVAYVSMR
jgi:hypothetical protein